MDSAGNLQWQRSYTYSYELVFLSVEIAHDSGYVVVGGGRFNSMDTGKSLIRKLNYAGETLWEKKYRGVGFSKVIRFNDGYFIGGGKGSGWDTSYVVLTKTNIYGDTLFTHTFPNNTNLEFFINLRQMNQGKIAISSAKDSINEFLFGKSRVVDSSLNIIYENTYPTTNYIIMSSVLPLPNGDILFAGEAEFEGVPFSVYVMRTDSMLRAPDIVIGIKQVNASIPKNAELHQNYPNPFNPTTKIMYKVPFTARVELRIFDLLGRLVSTPVDAEHQAGSFELELNMAGYSSGVYLYQLSINGNIFKTMKMILLK